VLVVWDTCRADRLSASGYARPTTPFLGARLREGVLFRNCYSPSCWTPPAHASLFTGLLPRHHGLREERSDRVRPDIETLPATLRARGYETVAFVSNPFLSPATGLTGGFETVASCYEERAEGKGDGGRILADLDAWLAARRARRSEKPLFLFVNLMETHLPYSAAPADLAAVVPPEARWAARDAAASVNQLGAFAHMFGQAPLAAETILSLGDAYDGAVRTVDRITEEILRSLEREGLLEGALVAVAGDHGENLGERGELDHVMSPREGVLRVPLFVRWPGRVEAGRVEEAQVRLQDLYPVFLEAAGVRAPGICGRDAVTLLQTPLRPRVAVAEFGPMVDTVYGVPGARTAAPAELVRRSRLSFLSVREPAGPGARKVIAWVRHPEKGTPIPAGLEMYDASADPREEEDLLAGEEGGAEMGRAIRLLDLARTPHPSPDGLVDQPGR
jgi:arylsulfatase A-like enzyme